MARQRDLNRTRERIMAAAQKEFAASGFAGARTDAIACRARVNERMIFYCFGSKEGLYRAVLGQKLSEKAGMLESTPDLDLTDSLVEGFAAACADADSLRMWQWEALDAGNRKLVAAEERRAFFRAEVGRLRRAKANGTLPADADEEMLLLVSCALRCFPLAMPQVPLLVAGMDPLDPEFRRRWSACLEWVGGRILAPSESSGDQLERQKAEKAEKSRGHSNPPIRTRPHPDATRRPKSAVKAGSTT
jgi:AcrR family transcriptional regulator